MTAQGRAITIMSPAADAKPLDPEKAEYFEGRSKQVFECRRYGHTFRPTHTGYLKENPGTPDEVWYQHEECRNGCGLTATSYYTPWPGLDRIGSRRIHYEDVPEYLGVGYTVSRQDARQYEALVTEVPKSERRQYLPKRGPRRSRRAA